MSPVHTSLPQSGSWHSRRLNSDVLTLSKLKLTQLLTRLHLTSHSASNGRSSSCRNASIRRRQGLARGSVWLSLFTRNLKRLLAERQPAHELLRAPVVLDRHGGLGLGRPPSVSSYPCSPVGITPTCHPAKPRAGHSKERVPFKPRSAGFGPVEPVAPGSGSMTH